MIVERWQNLTGQAAALEGDGRTFADVARQRLGDGGEPAETAETAEEASAAPKRGRKRKAAA